ncbi:MAG: branched-chain amino acid ABC transporter permease [Proteobacteria bacterium]|nr:branched-chain amino acid ABC transporter permease [Pseudomonadota bacterium]
MTFLLQMIVSGLLSGAVYALMALAVVVIYKSSSIFNFAHGSMVAFAAFLMWSLIVQFELPLLAALPLYVGCLFLVGYLIQRLIIQPLTGQPLMAAVMATIALGDVFAGIITLIWPGPGRTLPHVFSSKTLHLGPAVMSSEGLINFSICVLAFLAFFIFFQKTRIGLAMRGTAEDHALAQSEGIRVSWIFVVSWIVAILLAAVGGILMSSLYGVNSAPLHGLGMKSLAVVILGGLESIPGAIIGGLLIGLIESVGAGYLDPYVGGGLNDLMPFVVILLVLIFKPYGLFGYERIERM